DTDVVWAPRDDFGRIRQLPRILRDELQESSPDRACDGLTARKAPGRSGLPRTWLTRVRWAAWRVRTAARERPGLTGGRPPRGRPGLVGIHRYPGSLPSSSATIAARTSSQRFRICTVAPLSGQEPSVISTRASPSRCRALTLSRASSGTFRPVSATSAATAAVRIAVVALAW